MAGYIRQSTFVDGDTITAALFNNEYNQLVNVFSNTSGHKHDGTTAEGPVIGLIGDAGETSPNNKVLIDTTNNYIEFYVEVSSAPVQQLYIADGAIIPVTDSDIDLGTTSLRFKDTYTDTVTTTGNVSIGGNLTVTGDATISGNLTFGDADTDSINLAAEIDSNIVPNTDNTYDLGTATKEWRNLYIDGTANIDSLVADTADINGGTIDGATIATSDITVGAGKTLNVSAGTLTLADNQISGDKVEGGTIAATTITTLTSTTGNITTVNSTTTNATTVDSTNLEVTNLKAKDGTAAGSIADSTGVVTLGSSVLTTTDINGGTIDGVTIGGTTAGAVTFTDLSDGTITIAGFADEDNMVSNSATLLPTQQSVKAYVDSQVTAQDLDFQGDTGGALSIDLDSESLTIAGGTGLDTVGSGNTVTVNIDSTVATLTGTQTLTNKTLTSPDVNTPDIDGGTIDSTIIGGTTPAAGTFTTLTANTSITGTLATAAQPNITSVGALNGGSITSGFGSIDVGSSAITTTGTVTGGTLAGTLSTAAQPNITSVGSLTGLDVAGTPTFNGLTLSPEGSVITFNTSGTPDGRIKTGDNIKANSLQLESDNAVVINSGMDDGATSEVDGTFISRGSGFTKTALFDVNGDISFYDDTGTSQALFWDASAERLGIGTTSPNEELEIASSSPTIRLTDTDDSTYGAVSYNVGALFLTADQTIRFNTDSTERMRIDSLGNLLVGTTSLAVSSSTGSVTGAVINTTGLFEAAKTGTVMVLNRLTDDGEILEFNKDGSTVGSIGTKSADLCIGTDDTGIRFGDGGNAVIPHNMATNTTTDGIISFGTATERFKDLYLSGTVNAATLNVDGGTIKLDGNYPTGTGNVALGDSALASGSLTGGNNTAIGRESLTLNTTGASNTAVGSTSLDANTTGGNNTALGAFALDANTTASNNTAVGKSALTANTTGAQNVAVGSQSLLAHTTGNFNVAVGQNALLSNTTASNNTSVGAYSLDSNTTGAYNTAVGKEALGSNTTASNNTAMGYLALLANTTGHSNTAIGTNSQDSTTTAAENTSLGMNSAADITTGNSNTVIGYNAGSYVVGLTTGGGNVILGAYSRTSAAGNSYANVMGYDVSGAAGYTTLGQSGSDIRAQHGVATWSTVSDERVKKDITDATAGLSFINDLRPRTFKYKAKGDIPKEFDSYEEGSTEAYKNEFTNHGFIAQEVKEAIDNHPELKDGFKMWDVREHSGQQEVGEAAVIPVLVKAVQELSTQVDELKAEIQILKGE